MMNVLILLVLSSRGFAWRPSSVDGSSKDIGLFSFLGFGDNGFLKNVRNTEFPELDLDFGLEFPDILDNNAGQANNCKAGMPCNRNNNAGQVSNCRPGMPCNRYNTARQPNNCRPGMPCNRDNTAGQPNNCRPGMPCHATCTTPPGNLTTAKRVCHATGTTPPDNQYG